MSGGKVLAAEALNYSGAKKAKDTEIRETDGPQGRQDEELRFYLNVVGRHRRMWGGDRGMM